MVKKVNDVIEKVKAMPVIKKIAANPTIKDMAEVAGDNKKKLLATFAPPVIGAVAAGSLFAFLFYMHRKRKNRKEDNMPLKCDKCGCTVFTNTEDLFKQCECCGGNLVKVEENEIKK